MLVGSTTGHPAGPPPAPFTVLAVAPIPPEPFVGGRRASDSSNRSACPGDGSNRSACQSTPVTAPAPVTSVTALAPSSHQSPRPPPS